MNKAEKIMYAIGVYEGRKSMIASASNEMFRNLPVNDFGETSAEAVLELNKWVEYQDKKNIEKLTKAIKEA